MIRHQTGRASLAALTLAALLSGCSGSAMPATPLPTAAPSATTAAIAAAPTEVAPAATATSAPATATVAPTETSPPAPSATATLAATLTPAATAVPTRTTTITIYRARPGDTFSLIAANADVSMDAMLALNGLTPSSIIRVGQPLQLPPDAIPYEQWPIPTRRDLTPFTTDTPIPGSPEIKLGRDDQPWIALTFDTGYNPEVQREILKVLREHEIKATFLFVGNGVEQAPEVVSDVIADGHELGNHSFTHRSFLDLSREQVIAELRNTEAAVKKVDPNATTKPWLRTPFGHTNEMVREVAQQEGYYVVNWTVDSIDWVDGITADEVYWTMRRAIRPGAIIVQHGSSKASVVALQRIIPELRAEGYAFKTMSEITAPP